MSLEQLLIIPRLDTCLTTLHPPKFAYTVRMTLMPSTLDRIRGQRPDAIPPQCEKSDAYYALLPSEKKFDEHCVAEWPVLTLRGFTSAPPAEMKENTIVGSYRSSE
jgi:hypothetical protein